MLLLEMGRSRVTAAWGICTSTLRKLCHMRNLCRINYLIVAICQERAVRSKTLPRDFSSPQELASQKRVSESLVQSDFRKKSCFVRIGSERRKSCLIATDRLCYKRAKFTEFQPIMLFLRFDWITIKMPRGQKTALFVSLNRFEQTTARAAINRSTANNHLLLVPEPQDPAPRICSSSNEAHRT